LVNIKFDLENFQNSQKFSEDFKQNTIFIIRRLMNRAHPNFGHKTKLGEREWWRRLIKGDDDYKC
jgi:hypothetical protein